MLISKRRREDDYKVENHLRLPLRFGKFFFFCSPLSDLHVSLGAGTAQLERPLKGSLKEPFEKDME